MPRTVSQTINLQTPDQTGKYITDISSSNGIQIHAINNVGSNYTQIDSNGLTVYNGGINVAQFGSIAQIGNVNNTHIQMDYRSLRLIDKEGNAYLYISDLRDKNDNNYATITETFVGNGSTKTFNVQLEVDVEVSATDSSDSTNLANRLGDTYTFTTAPADGATITIVYKTASSMAKAYTFGQRSTSGQIGAMSIAEGYNTVASGYISHSEGCSTIASGFASHAEGYNTIASGFAHAEGWNTTASTTTAHAEGYGSIASAMSAHAEGNTTTASGSSTHAEGYHTVASINSAHAEGNTTTASGRFSHSQNLGTIAKCKSQTALGEYNIADTSIYESIRGNYAIIVGNGTADDARSNALTVDWNGNVDIASGAQYKVGGIPLSASYFDLVASYSNSNHVLSFGNFRIYCHYVTVPNTGRVSLTFPSGTFSQVLWAIPYCAQGGFGGYDTTSVTELTTSKVTLYQFNSAGANMNVGVVVFGLA